MYIYVGNLRTLWTHIRKMFCCKNVAYSILISSLTSIKYCINHFHGICNARFYNQNFNQFKFQCVYWKLILKYFTTKSLFLQLAKLGEEIVRVILWIVANFPKFPQQRLKIFNSFPLCTVFKDLSNHKSWSANTKVTELFKIAELTDLRLWSLRDCLPILTCHPRLRVSGNRTSVRTRGKTEKFTHQVLRVS